MSARLLRTAASVASGCLLFLACASFDIWPLAWIGIVPLLAVVLDDRCRHPFFYGWVTGLLANGGGFYWINGLLMRFGHLPLVASLPVYLLLVAYQAITFGLFAWIVRHLRDGTRLPMIVLAPVAMTALELLVPFIFPWYLAITQAWVRPVIQIADLTGPLGVTFLLVLTNGALHDAFADWLPRGAARDGPAEPAAPSRVRLRPIALAALAIALVLGYGQVRIRQVEAARAAAPKVKVGVVQANIGIHEKWVPERAADQLTVHQRLSAELAGRGAELVVWPESSYPYPIDRAQQRDFPARDRRQAMRGWRVPLLFGALTFTRGDPYPFNTALMMDASGAITATFDKNFLLVFGEYIPFYEHVRWFQDLIPAASNFARGDGVATFPLDTAAGHFKVGPMICYEDIIPSFGRRLAAEKPNLLVNLTNDAWFGATSEPWEHLALSVYRAVEHRLDLVRAVNTGVSAFVDATGRVQARGAAVDPDLTPDAGPVTLLVDAAMLEAGGLYQHLGEAFGIANLAVLIALGVRVRRRRGTPIAWGLLGLGTLALLALLAVSLPLSAPSSPWLALGLLTHRPQPSSAETFGAGLRLLACGALASVAAGRIMAQLARRVGLARSPRVEAGTAAVLAFLVPPLLLGRIEGETAGIVFSAAGAFALTLLGLRLGERRAPLPPAAPTPTPLPTLTPTTPPTKKPAGRKWRR